MFNVDLSPQGMNPLIIFTILINIPPMIFPSFVHSDTPLLVQVEISLSGTFYWKKILWQLLNITQK